MLSGSSAHGARGGGGAGSARAPATGHASGACVGGDGFPGSAPPRAPPHGEPGATASNALRGLSEISRRDLRLVELLKRRLARGACAHCAACPDECNFSASDLHHVLFCVEREIARLSAVRTRARARRASGFSRTRGPADDV
jgi:hypothetical protein